MNRKHDQREVSARMALRYLEAASEWDRIMSINPLIRKDKEFMKIKLFLFFGLLFSVAIGFTLFVLSICYVSGDFWSLLLEPIFWGIVCCVFAFLSALAFKR